MNLMEKYLKKIAKKHEPVRHIMEKKYKELCFWLKSYPVTAEEIQEHSPELLNDIHRAIEIIDRCFLSENLQEFNEGMERVKQLYMKAMERVLNNEHP